MGTAPRRSGKRWRTGAYAVRQQLRAFTPHPAWLWVFMIASGFGYFLMWVSAAAIGPLDIEWLIRMGGGYGPSTTDGQWWRLLTGSFLHAGLMHLLVNMLGLLLVGWFAEQLFGHVGFAVLYLGSTIVGSLVGLFFDPGLVHIGASAGVFGCVGGVLGFLLRRWKDRDLRRAFHALWMFAIVFVGVSLLYAFLAELGPYGVIDHAAHAGGLATGLVVGLIMGHPISPEGARSRTRRAGLAAAVLAPVVVLLAVLVPRTDDVLGALVDLGHVEGETAEHDMRVAYRIGADAREIERDLVPLWSRLEGRFRRLERLPPDWAPHVALLQEYVTLRRRLLEEQLEELRNPPPAGAESPSSGTRAEIERLVVRMAELGPL